MKKRFILILSVVVFFWGCNNINPPETVLITSFLFSVIDNQMLDATVYAVVTGTSITAEFPDKTDITSLRPTIEMMDGSDIMPASGSVLNFSRPVYFIVTSQQGDSITYTATVTLAEK